MRMTGNTHEIITLSDLNYKEELPETHFTLEENALEKVRFVYHYFQQDCFAEDTGLEIDTLNGKPGVFSARYGGGEKNSEKNIARVLSEMKEDTNRKASFRTVIALIISGKEYLFEGRVNGIILKEKKGTAGFGYDSVFQPDGFTESFSEMTEEEKNSISHRARAFQKMKDFLRTKINCS